MSLLAGTTEVTERFACFGSRCAVHVAGEGPLGDAAGAGAALKRQLLAWNAQFTRFDAGSELSRLNRDSRVTVPVSTTMSQLIDAVAAVASVTGGLVDGTLVEEIQAAGYDRRFAGHSVALANALALAPPRRAASPSARGAWRELVVDRAAMTVTRPNGVQVDSGGVAKGLFADVLAGRLEQYESFAIDCGGDIAIGGTDGAERHVEVAGPFDGGVLHRFGIARGAVATSGIGKRSWLGPDGRPAHHLLDPSTGAPAFTGIVQVTALAPTAVLAEALSKAALLSGPAQADRWLTRGGVIVYDDGSHRVL